MEIIDHTDTMLRIHHIPYVPRHIWFMGMLSGTMGVAILIWVAMHNGSPIGVVIGGLFTLIGLWSMLTDERHIIWAFNKQEGLLTVRYDGRSKEVITQYALYDIRDAVIQTRPSAKYERGDTFRDEVVLRFRHKHEALVLPMIQDTVDWQEKRNLVALINTWLRTPTATWYPYHDQWRSVFDASPVLLPDKQSAQSFQDVRLTDF